MKVLVTGATGFIGRNLTDELSGKGWKVKALVRSRSRLKGLRGRNVEVVIGDLKDKNSLKSAVRCVDIVFNSAAALPFHNLADKKYWQANVEGVNNLMEASEKLQVKRVVHISTVGIYGPTSKIGVSEKAKPKLSDVYSKTKLEGEKIVGRYIEKGLPATIIRPTIAYGPGDTRPGFLNLFTLIKKGMFVRLGKENNFFHTVYIKNLVDALVLAATKKSAVGEDFIIGDELCPTMGQITKTIAKVQSKKLSRFYLPIWMAESAGVVFDLAQKLRLPAPLTTRRVRFMTEDKKYKIDKAKKTLGYMPKVGLEEGIRKTYDWYRKKELV